MAAVVVCQGRPLLLKSLPPLLMMSEYLVAGVRLVMVRVWTDLLDWSAGRAVSLVLPGPYLI